MSAGSNSVIRRRWLLWRAVLRLAMASLGLRLFSFRRMQSWIGRKSEIRSQKSEGVDQSAVPQTSGAEAAESDGRTRRSAPTTTKYSPEELARALQRGSRLVPGSTCLVQALAGQWLLQGEGYPAQLRIGVSKAEGFEAHAWVELEGKVLIGDSEVSARFTPFPPVECP